MLKLYLSCLIILGFIHSTFSQILAIDFGTQYIKASVVHTGAGKSFSIVENHKSQRKFDNALTFFKEERFYQTDALFKRNKIPQNTFVYSRVLIDFMEDSKTLQLIKKEQLLQYIKTNEPNQLHAQFFLKNFPQGKNQITSLDIFAMILKHVKFSAQIFIKSTIKDCVIAIPSHWDLHMRSFIKQAAQVAELYVISMISENTAVAINYAMSMRSNTNETERVLFYNVGANSLQISLVQFKALTYQKHPKPIESIFVLGDYGKSYVGGLKFDHILAEHFYKKFEQKHKIPLTVRAKIKILQQVQNVKQILTANKDASLFVQGIINGIDYQQKITRQEFSRLSEGLVQQLVSPIRRFLLENDMKPSEIKTVQMVGGGVRIPRVQTMLAELFGSQANIGTHINGDESAALGSAFFAANSSKKFKVKGLHLYDGFNFQIRLVIKNLDESITEGSEGYISKNVTVFEKKSRFGLLKQITFRCKENIIIEIYKEDEKGLELLSSAEMNTIKDISQADFKVSFTLVIDPIDVVDITQAKYIFKKQQVTTYVEKVKKQKSQSAQTETDTKTEEKQQETQQEKQQEKEQEKDEYQEKQQSQEQKQQEKNEQQEKEEQKEEEQKEKQQKQQSSAQQKQQSKDERKEQKKSKKDKKVQDQYETVTKNKTTIKKHEKPLVVKSRYARNQTDTEVLELSKKLLKSYEQYEQTIRKLHEAKNKLEATIYETRDNLENQQFNEFVKESQSEDLKKKLEEQSAWMQQTQSENTDDYTAHYKNLYDILVNIKKRKTQFLEREIVKKRAIHHIDQYANLTEKLKKEKSWITDEQIEELRALVTTQREKINNIYREMNKIAKNQDQVFRNKDFLKTAEILKNRYFEIKATEKPKEKKQEKEKENKQDKQQQKDSQDSDQQL